MARTYESRPRLGRKKFCVELSPDAHEMLRVKAKEANLPQYELIERIARSLSEPTINAVLNI